MNKRDDPCTAHFRRVHQALGAPRPFFDWMNKHAFMLTLWKQDPGHDGLELAREWHRALVSRIYDDQCAFRPVIYGTDTDPPKSYVHALLLIPDEALHAFKELRAKGHLPHIPAVAQTVVEPFNERLVRRRFPRHPDRCWLWTSLMARNLRPPAAV